MMAMDLLEQTGFGKECAGVITRVGSQVPLKVGDRVAAIVDNGMSTYHLF